MRVDIDLIQILNDAVAESSSGAVSQIEERALAIDSAYSHDDVGVFLDRVELPAERSLLLGRPAGIGMDLTYFVISHEERVVIGLNLESDGPLVTLLDFTRREGGFSFQQAYTTQTKGRLWEKRDDIYVFAGSPMDQRQLLLSTLSEMNSFRPEEN